MEDNETTLLEFVQPQEVRPGSSKRKRSQTRDYHVASTDGSGKHVDHQDSHTPKRSRQTIDEVDEQNHVSDSRQRSIRRKHGKYGLSAISKAHAQESEKGSKFIEGSMNDKPSVNPPSMFTRDVSNHSLTASSHSGINVDHLMQEYHEADARASAHPSVEAQQPVSPARPPPIHDMFSPVRPPSEYLSHQTPETKPSGLYRFGRMVATSFNPAHVWGSFSRTFRDTKDEMTARNIEENRRKVEEMRLKAQQKGEAEARYAEMKASGVFAKPVYTVVRNGAPPIRVQQEEEEDDEAAEPLRDFPRDSAMADQLVSKSDRGRVPPNPQPTRQSESTNPGTPPLPAVPLRAKKSFFGSLRKPSFQSLKKVRSEYSLGISGQSSTSLDPQVVTPGHSLPRSHSRKELNKQHKLSKRVSDLEVKLGEARRELTHAINTASPLPDFPTRFEKFTPGKHTPTITSKFRSRFIPGKLPSLPSERLFSVDQQPRVSHESTGTVMELFTPAARTSSIATQPTLDPEATSFPVPMSQAEYMGEKPLPDPPVLEEEPTPSAQPTVKMVDMDDIETRLKALDDHVEGRNKKKGGNKKRKSDFEDKEYRPGKELEKDDDDDGFEAPRKSKKRKSASKSDAKRSSSDTTIVKKNPPAKKSTLPVETPTPSSNVAEPNIVGLNRTSTHVSVHSDPLDPIYEEDTMTTKTKHASSIVVTVTQANPRSTSRSSLRQMAASSRSASPDKSAREASPPPAAFSDIGQTEEETITLKPGVGEVPNLPNVSMRGRKKKTPKASVQNFQWPDDVF